MPPLTYITIRRVPAGEAFGPGALPPSSPQRAGDGFEQAGRRTHNAALYSPAAHGPARPQASLSAPAATCAPALPAEVWAHVFSMLPKASLVFELSRVCRDWRSLARQRFLLAPKLWRTPMLPRGDAGADLGDAVQMQSLREAQLVRAVAQRPKVICAHAGPLRAACFSPDSYAVIVANYEGYVGWQQLLFAPGHRAQTSWHGIHASRIVHQASFSADAQAITLASHESVTIVWPRFSTPRLERVGNAQRWACFSAAFSPDAKQLLAVTQNDVLAIWPTDSLGDMAQELVQPPMRRSPFWGSCQWSRCGAHLAGLTGLGDIFLYNARALNQAPVRVPTSQAHTIVFSPDGAYLAAGYMRGRVRIFSTQAPHKPVAMLRAQRACVCCLAFSHDNRYLAFGSQDGLAVVWAFAARRGHARLLGHGRAVTSIAFNLDDSLVLTASNDGRLRLWPKADFPRFKPIIDARESRLPVPI